MATKITKLLFSIYLAALVWILLLKLGVKFSYMGSRSVNLIPFREALMANGKIDHGEIILNIVIFIPLGIYAGVLYERWNFRTKIIFIGSISLAFESLQYIFKIGAFDITDIITNTTGGIIGLLIYQGIEKVFNNSVKTQKIINVMAAIATGVMVTLLVLLKMNMLPLRYQ